MSAPVQWIEFGPFRLSPLERRLVKNDRPVPLGSRALDILLLLVEQAGNVVSKQELLARVWPEITVEESSLRVHVAGLRRALGDGREGARYVANIAGRGYCFVGQITRRETPRAASSAGGGLPRRPTRMIGRDDDLRAITELLAARRFVTIHGPGGIGKTTVTLALLHERADIFQDGIRFLDLGLRKARNTIPDILASALGLMVQSSDPTPSIVNYLRDRRMLLVLDCCEHVIDSAAALAEAIFQEAPGVSILTTSREPLRVEGEHVYPLAPLGVPPVGAPVSATHLPDYPASCLFLERALAGGYRSALSDDDAHTVAEICRKVEGIALAIELAAGRVSTHGLQETATLLDSRLKLLWRGRRTALPRHQTLNATLDWSHALIADCERVVLRRLSVFVGPFTLEEAREVAGDERVEPVQVVEALAQLVAKSLVFADTSERTTRYRLLDTTRAYAQAKLAESGEEDVLARRHAAYYLNRLSRSGAEASAEPDRGEPLGPEHLGNIRIALEWSFSEAGDVGLGIRLAAGAAQLFLSLSLLAECRRWCESALAALRREPRDLHCEMTLQAALGYSLMFTKGNSEQARAAHERALEIAEALGAPACQFRLLAGLHMYYCRMGDFSRLIPIARRAAAIAPALDDAVAIADAYVMLGASHHLDGSLGEAQVALQASLRQLASTHGAKGSLLGYHREVQIFIARNLWLQGYPDQAVDAARAAERVERQNPVATCLALIWGATVFHLTGDWATLEDYVERLMKHAGEHSFEPYKAVGFGFKGDILVQRGEVDAGMALLREALGSLQAYRYDLYTAWPSCSLAECLARRGHLDQALGLVDIPLAAARRHRGAYNMAELLRIRGDLLSQAGDEVAAEGSYRQSLAVADEQAALSWRLRTATSLARLRARQGRLAEARVALTDSYDRFTEGFGTADLRAARQLLAQLDRTGAD